MINYFNFKKFNNDFLLTNDLGCYIFLKPQYFRELLDSEKISDPYIQLQLEDKAFVYSSSITSFLDRILHSMRYAKDYLFNATQLHIFVVSTVCNLNCIYCQAQDGERKPTGMMTIDVARKAVDIALQSPSKVLQFEFQGGEPLLNFDVIRFIVEYSKEKANGKIIHYSIVTNLTLLTKKMIDFIVSHEISVSTSLDGHAVLHNINRPVSPDNGSYQQVRSQISILRQHGIHPGALQTTTKFSLNYPKQIVDEYVQSGFNNITIRSLTPLGSANKKWEEIGYNPKEFLSFYKTAFDHILEYNKKGIFITEGIARIFLKKILVGHGQNYMELRSPCGASVGQIAYYYDGKIYTCDEGRMIAEMGDTSFQLGNVFEDDYNILLENTICKGVCSASILESLPSCTDCVYQPYCGVYPVVNYILYGDLYERSPNNYQCMINKGILDIIFHYLQENDKNILDILYKWI